MCSGALFVFSNRRHRAYFRVALSRLPRMNISQISELPPAAWAEAQKTRPDEIPSRRGRCTAYQLLHFQKIVRKFLGHSWEMSNVFNHKTNAKLLNCIKLALDSRFQVVKQLRDFL